MYALRGQRPADLEPRRKPEKRRLPLVLGHRQAPAQRRRPSGLARAPRGRVARRGCARGGGRSSRTGDGFGASVRGLRRGDGAGLLGGLRTDPGRPAANARPGARERSWTARNAPRPRFPPDDVRGFYGRHGVMRPERHAGFKATVGGVDGASDKAGTEVRGRASERCVAKPASPTSVYGEGDVSQSGDHRGTGAQQTSQE